MEVPVLMQPWMMLNAGLWDPITDGAAITHESQKCGGHSIAQIIRRTDSRKYRRVSEGRKIHRVPATAIVNP